MGRWLRQWCASLPHCQPPKPSVCLQNYCHSLPPSAVLPSLSNVFREFLPRSYPASASLLRLSGRLTRGSWGPRHWSLQTYFLFRPLSSLLSSNNDILLVPLLFWGWGCSSSVPSLPGMLLLQAYTRSILFVVEVRETRCSEGGSIQDFLTVDTACGPSQRAHLPCCGSFGSFHENVKSCYT